MTTSGAGIASTRSTALVTGAAGAIEAVAATRSTAGSVGGARTAGILRAENPTYAATPPTTATDDSTRRPSSRLAEPRAVSTSHVILVPRTAGTRPAAASASASDR